MDDIQFFLARACSVEEVGPLWAGLDKDGGSSFFLSWTWIGTWLSCLPERVQPHLLTATRGGAPVGAAILVARRERRRGVLNVRQLHLNATGDPALDCIWIEHNGFLGSAAEQRELWPAFLRWFAQQSGADELLVRRADDAIGKPPPDAKLLHGAITLPAFRCPLGSGGFEAILARASSSTRQQLRRSLRACEVLGELRCEAADSVETALEWFDVLKALHVASWDARGQPHAFRYSFWEFFHRALIARGVPQGSVELLRISAGAMPLGYLYNFRRGRTAYAYQSGFDYAREDLKPGYVSHLLAMARSASEGATCYDFLAGDNQLKRSLGRERYALTTQRVARRSVALRIEAALRQVRSSPAAE